MEDDNVIDMFSVAATILMQRASIHRMNQEQFEGYKMRRENGKIKIFNTRSLGQTSALGPLGAQPV